MTSDLEFRIDNLEKNVAALESGEDLLRQLLILLEGWRLSWQRKSKIRLFWDIITCNYFLDFHQWLIKKWFKDRKKG